jgi:hypothetical protein
MASGDYLQLVDWQSIQGVDCFNVYHYYQSAGSVGAQYLNAAFLTEVLPSVISVQSSDVTHHSLLATNYDDFADYYFSALTSDNVGLEGTSSLPAFVGWTYRYIRAERGHHHGRKCIPGIATGDQVDGEAVSGLATALGNLGTVLGDDISFSGSTFSPRIMRAPNTIKPSYDNARNFYPVNGVVYVRISSQNSRKH